MAIDLSWLRSMNIAGVPTRTIRFDRDRPDIVQVIDQRQLPHHLVWQDLTDVETTARAIEDMVVRGAPLIGATAAMGMFLAAKAARSQADFREAIEASAQRLLQTRPTAVNLHWAIARQLARLADCQSGAIAVDRLRAGAIQILDDDVRQCAQIGEHGVPLIAAIYARTGKPVNILTHCNAGWLACVDWGTATSPIYQAFDRGIPLHVWVDETRPRNQGAKLTAWELGQHGIPHTLIADNVGGHLMQHGMADLVIVGSDRTTRNGNVANKIGTYLKALAAQDNKVPFYVALPSSTIDWSLRDGLREIPIEQRSDREVKYMDGRTDSGAIVEVLICPETSPAANYGFDVTPARLVTGLITERGICAASEAGLRSLFPEQFPE
jgi:methylthioribose-1-phosphate isomerase